MLDWTAPKPEEKSLRMEDYVRLHPGLRQPGAADPARPMSP
jgi:hypothetical protein